MSKVRIPPKKIIMKDFDGDNVPEDFEFPSIGIEDIEDIIEDLTQALESTK